MASLRQKLARLGEPSRRREASPEHVPGAFERGPSSGSGEPTLDELRCRIASILAKSRIKQAPADPTAAELPFFFAQTETGPLYSRRVSAGAAARVGRAPLVAARDADPGLLSLFALDPTLAQCDPKRALYLDTETTGLGGGTGTVAFLIGLCTYDECTATFTLEQTFLRRLGEEAPMLELLAERIREASVIVTFNGKAFDWPLLRTRYVMNRLPVPVVPPHLDLVHVARRIHGGRLPSCALVSVEELVLGRVRTNDTHGKDIVTCYAHFLRTGDEEALVGVVEHNAMDVLSMVALVGLYGAPLGNLDPVDCASAAGTLKRARAFEKAEELARHAYENGARPEALKQLAAIAKALGEKAKALTLFEALIGEAPEAAVRLELSKLYEHHARNYESALDCTRAGTGETDSHMARRTARLLRKIDRAAGKARGGL